jgi:hypothetical protein
MRKTRIVIPTVRQLQYKNHGSFSLATALKLFKVLHIVSGVPVIFKAKLDKSIPGHRSVSARHCNNARLCNTTTKQYS